LQIRQRQVEATFEKENEKLKFKKGKLGSRKTPMYFRIYFLKGLAVEVLLKKDFSQKFRMIQKW
jgi:hypothetical protein